MKFAKERNRLSVLVCHHFIMKQRTNTEQHVIHNIAAYAHKHSAETETLCFTFGTFVMAVCCSRQAGVWDRSLTLCFLSEVKILCVQKDMLKLHTYKYIFIHLIKKMQFPVLYIHNYINAQRQTWLFYDLRCGRDLVFTVWRIFKSIISNFTTLENLTMIFYSHPKT